MATYTFAIVHTQVSDNNGNAVKGHVKGIQGAYANALKQRLSDYWMAMSSGRVRLQWAPDIDLTLTQHLHAWKALGPRERIDQVRPTSGYWRSASNLPTQFHGARGVTA